MDRTRVKLFLIISLFLAIEVFAANLLFTGSIQDMCSYIHVDISKKFTQTGVVLLEENYSKFKKPVAHYAPGIYLLLGGLTSFFGCNLPLMRFFFSFSYALSALVFFALVSKLWNSRAAFYSVIFYLFSPAVLIWSDIIEPNISGITMLFYLLTIYYYFKFLDDTKYIFLMGGSFLLGIFVGWPVFYLFLILPVHYFLYRRNLRKGALLLIFFAGLSSMLVLYFYAVGIRPLFFLERMRGVSLLGIDYSIKQSLREEIYNLICFSAYYFNFYILAISALSLFIISWRRRASTLSFWVSKKRSFLLILLLTGLFTIAGLWHYMFVHEFFLVYFIPFLSFLCGWGFTVFPGSLLFREEQDIKFKPHDAVIYSLLTVVFSIYFSYGKFIKRIDWIKPQMVLAFLLLAVVAMRYIYKAVDCRTRRFLVKFFIYSLVIFMVLSVMQFYWDNLSWQGTSMDEKTLQLYYASNA